MFAESSNRRVFRDFRHFVPSLHLQNLLDPGPRGCFRSVGFVWATFVSSSFHWTDLTLACWCPTFELSPLFPKLVFKLLGLHDVFFFCSFVCLFVQVCSLPNSGFFFQELGELHWGHALPSSELKRPEMKPRLVFLPVLRLVGAKINNKRSPDFTCIRAYWRCGAFILITHSSVHYVTFHGILMHQT